MRTILPRRVMRTLLVLSGVLGLLAAAPDLQAGALLDGVKSRGAVRCGVSEGTPGFSIERGGRWSGLDTDYCRALGVALFGRADAVEFVPLDVRTRFEALRDARVDVLSRNSTWSLAREADFDITFVGILSFDGQPKRAGAIVSPDGMARSRAKRVLRAPRHTRASRLTRPLDRVQDGAR